MVQALNDFNQMQVKMKEMEEIITSLDETSGQIKDKCLQFKEVFQYNRPCLDFWLDSDIIQSMDITIRHLRFFYYIFHIKPHLFSKKYYKAISGQIFMKFLLILFVYPIVIFVCMVFVFWWSKHKCWFFRFYFG